MMGSLVAPKFKLRRAGQLAALIALAATLAAVVGVAPAFATPKGEFAVFADCPTATAQSCLFAKTETGKIGVGKEIIPIEKSIILQGGLNESGSEFQVVAAKDGNTLQKSPQKVPGGLSGLVKCNEISNVIERISCELFFENGVTGVTATTELAAPASSIHLNIENYGSGEGTALSLPVKVHLENPFLGSSCYVGSNSHPIVINLTTGTSGSVTGNPGTFEALGEEEIFALSNRSLVNGTFAAPTATGCGGIFSFLIDPIVDSRLGLPSASGKNVAVLNGKIELTEGSNVIAHE